MQFELLFLADTALPVGGAAHSFGIETLVEEGTLHVEALASFLSAHLSEAGRLDASFVVRARRGECAHRLNREFGARRIARESREAGMKMGRRLAQLINALLPAPAIPETLCYPVAFGVAGASLKIGELDLVMAYLRQSAAGLVSACQRLLPLGQVEASRIVWGLRSSIEEVAECAVASELTEVSCFSALPELASSRHGLIETRLFIS